MSRFIKYASNLLDGVDNIAKDSLTDQDIAAAAAAERRRKRRQSKQRGDPTQLGGGVSAAEQSEGGMSEDGSQYYDKPGGDDATRPQTHHKDARDSSFDEGGDTAEDYDGMGRAKNRRENRSSGSSHRNFSDVIGGERGQRGGRGGNDTGAENRSSTSVASFGSDVEHDISPIWREQGQEHPATREAEVATVPPQRTLPGSTTKAGGTSFSPQRVSPSRSSLPSQGDGEPKMAVAAETVAPATVATSQRSDSPNPRRYSATVGGGAPGKEDGSVWSDHGTISSAAPSLVGQGPGSRRRREEGHDSGGIANYGDPAFSTDGAEPLQSLSSPLSHPELIDGTPAGAIEDGQGTGGGARGEEQQDGEDRPIPATGTQASSVDSGMGVTPASIEHANGSEMNPSVPDPKVIPSKEQQQQQQEQREQRRRRLEEEARGTSDAGSSRAVDPRDSAHEGDGGLGGGDHAGEPQGLGKFLRMGVQKAGRGMGAMGRAGEVEALRVEASELRAEVEELSLELEDAEDRLRGQEAELKDAADRLQRQRTVAKEREDETNTEMEQLRTLQAEEKKVFLANLEATEKTAKEKEREADEARAALSAIENFAMEREDAITRLGREKEELIRELNGARSGQDRSAEEVREALTRAEAEAEEVEARHRTWMRQAQARQTELEATAAQLAEALAEEKRIRSAGGAEGSQQGSQAGNLRRAQASDRELRAFRDELDSCQASLELEQERTRSLQQELTALRQDLDAARATEAVVERQRQEHAKMAADSFAKAARLEQQLKQEKASARRLGASVPPPAGPESQIQSLSSKLLEKQARLEESVRERATLSAKLKEASGRAFKAEQELRESRGDSLEAGGEVGSGRMRSRRRIDRLGGGRASPAGSWSKLAPIAKHKKIASAVDVLDRQTLKGVVFLRTSSVARASFLGYLLLLHLWAFMILSFHSLDIVQCH